MEKFVVAIKNQGKILREREGAVYLPFGSEYSILMKNLNSRKALVSISIDGKDIGDKLIIDANRSIDLDCFVDKMNNNNRLKFVQFTKDIQNNLGDNIENGFIRVEVVYEKEKPKVNEITCWNYHNIYQPPIFYEYEPTWKVDNFTTTCCNNDVAKTVNSNCLRSGSCVQPMSVSSITFDSCDEPLQDEGISVPGSVSNQSFIYGNIGELEENKTVLILQLKGFKLDGNSIKEAVTVKYNIICKYCGKKNDSLNKYCGNCGAYLS